jgi:gluconate:H+ symporter, GntP family
VALLILTLGVAVVLGGILALRLHPVLALLLGSLVLLLLTPRASFLENELAAQSLQIQAVEGTRVRISGKWEPGSYQFWPRGALPSREPLHFDAIGASNGESWLQLAAPPSVNVELAAGGRLVKTGALKKAEAQRWQATAERLGNGLGGTFGRIGLSIVTASIIGACLLASGAALRIVGGLGRVFGERHTPRALAVSAFILCIPTYFETVFFLLLPLAKAHGAKHRGRYLLAVMAVIVGATMAHSLVPPTPGPLFVAAELGVPLGVMMAGGIIVGSCTACVGYAYGTWCNRRASLQPEGAFAEPTASKATASPAVSEPGPEAPADSGRTRMSDALPIALPIVALTLKELLRGPLASMDPGGPLEIVRLLGEPGVALLLSALFAVMQLRLRTPASDTQRHVQRAVTDAGTILMLTCSGGAFGAAIKGLRLSEALSAALPSSTTPFSLLLLAFGLTLVLRGAQGSATVAMITSASIVAPIVSAISLPFHAVYLALAIGCGSKPLCWMNDSGFWQVSGMTGMTPSQTLRTFSAALSLMGVAGFVLCLLGAWLLPFKP